MPDLKVDNAKHGAESKPGDGLRNALRESEAVGAVGSGPAWVWGGSRRHNFKKKSLLRLLRAGAAAFSGCIWCGAAAYFACVDGAAVACVGDAAANSDWIWSGAAASFFICACGGAAAYAN